MVAVSMLIVELRPKRQFKGHCKFKSHRKLQNTQNIYFLGFLFDVLLWPATRGRCFGHGSGRQYSSTLVILLKPFCGG